MPDAGIIGIFFPQPLPMHVDINVVIVDHDALDPKVHGDIVEQLKIGFRLLLQTLGRLSRHHKRGHAGSIFLHVRFPKRLDRFVNTKIPLMIFGILNRFRAAAGPEHPEKADKDRERADMTSQDLHREAV